MKKVTILLTRYSDHFSRFITKISSGGYSHASISIDGDEEIFYSFNVKGFVIEKPKKRKPQSRMEGSVCIRMWVPEDTYRNIEMEILQFLENKEFYTYSRLGVV